MTRRKTYLSIRKQDQILDFERYLGYKDLNERPFRLPNSIGEAGSIGRSASLAQLILTWQRQSIEPITQTYLTFDNHAAYERFVSNLHGLAATYFSNHVLATGSEHDIKTELLHAAAPRIRAMAYGNLVQTSRGKKIEFIFIHGATNEFHNTFYHRKPVGTELDDRQRHGQLIASPSQFNSFLRSCLGAFGSIPKNKRWKNLEYYLSIPEIPFGTIIHEIFRNTAEHAYLFDHNGTPHKDLRCLMVTLHQVSRDHLRDVRLLSVSRPEANRYFQALSRASGDYVRKYVDLLEISILDSGPGFAATMSARAAGDDRQLVANCFRKHQSVKLGPASGIGLYRVLSAVHQLSGFIRVRTSTTEAFYASTSDYRSDLDPLSYTNGGLSRVSGTLITIGIPLVY